MPIQPESVESKTFACWSTIFHSRDDDVIPFTDSEGLVWASGLPVNALIEIGTDYCLAEGVVDRGRVNLAVGLSEDGAGDVVVGIQK